MNICNVTDSAFKPCGQALPGCDTSCLVKEMETIPMSASGTTYEPGKASTSRRCWERLYHEVPTRINRHIQEVII